MAKRGSSGCAIVVAVVFVAGVAAWLATKVGMSATWTFWLTVVAIAGIGLAAKFVAITRRRSTQRPVGTASRSPADRVFEEDGIRVTLTPGDLGSPDHFMTKVAGVTHRRNAVGHAREGDSLLLLPEPENPHDRNAIRVMLERTDEHLGYLNRPRAEYIARQMAGGAIYSACIEKETGGGLFKERGLNIRVWRSGWDIPKSEAVRAADQAAKEAKKAKRPRRKKPLTDPPSPSPPS